MDLISLEPHPLCLEYPDMTPEEYDILCADIHRIGTVHEPILLFEGKTLDGRHRVRAILDLLERGINVRYHVTDFKGNKREAEDLVYSSNMARRHLIASQRALLALQHEERLKNSEDSNAVVKIQPNGNKRNLSAERFNVSPETMRRAEKIIETAPHLKHVIADGGMTLGDAEREIQKTTPDYKRDSKINQGDDGEEVAKAYDTCQTPGYAIDPLLPYLREGQTIWEPACGEGNLVEAFYDAGLKVIASDIITGQSFFTYEPDEHWDLLVTNPPYSIKARWIERCYELGRPFALLMPVEVLGNKGPQDFFCRFGMELIVMDKRIPFKMPYKGWEGAGPQFSVAWYTYGLGIGRDITYAEITR